jgi:hypothetical protein
VARQSAIELAQKDGTYVRGSGPGIYVIEHGWRRAFPTWDTYLRSGGQADLSNTIAVSDLVLALIPQGPVMASQ